MAEVKAIPDEYPGVTAYLIVRGASRAIAWYKKVLDAKETFRAPMPDGRISHAELRIGGGRFMLTDEMLEHQVKSPQLLGGSPVGLLLYVGNVDAVVERAVAAGATILRPIATAFYGDRTGTIVDPFGHQWTISTHVEDVSPDELQRRMAQRPA